MSSYDSFKKAELIVKFLEGTLSDQEVFELDQWLKEDPANQEIFDKFCNEQLLDKEIQSIQSIDVDQAWQRFVRERKKTKEKPLHLWQYAVAATIILGIGLSLLLFSGGDRRPVLNTNKTYHNYAKAAASVKPGGDRALLTLADGSVIELESVKNGLVKEAHGIKISRQNGLVIYSVNALSDSVKQTAFNLLTTPVGGQFQILLPDSSRVWLNAASSLRFPTAFAANDRTVELTGEAYFEVAHKARAPFNVKVNGVNVQVLGTHFNIMAYGQEGKVNTTLLQGSVKVSKDGNSKIIKPGQQAEIENADAQVSVKVVDVKTAVAWKDGIFQFKETDLPSVMRQLERWYGIDVNYEAGVPAVHFTGMISRRSSISSVLQMLEVTGNVQLHLEGRTVHVLAKQKKQ